MPTSSTHKQQPYYIQIEPGTYSYVRVSVCLSVCGQVLEIVRDTNIDLLPYSELYVQPGPGTYSHVRVFVCLSVCPSVDEFRR